MNMELQTSSRRKRLRPTYIPTDPLLTAQESAIERGQGLSTFWRDVKNGSAPQPFYVGRKSPRWRQSAIKASVDACATTKPSNPKFTVMK